MAVGGDAPADAENASLRAARWAGLTAITLLLLRIAAALPFVDPDLFHEIALVREGLVTGTLPRDDVFAYVPTIHPAVHHEWGAGALFYAATHFGGPVGLFVLKYALVLALGALTVKAARLRGASWPLVFALAPLATMLAQNGFATVRAQLFTMTFTALVMVVIELDRRGHRRWVAPFLVLHVIWLNLHGGFVFGMILLGAHWLEQLVRGKGIQPHLVVVGLAMAALALVNPWGVDYPKYLLRALTMPRIVTEWRPLWEIVDPTFLLVYGFTLILAAYALARGGWRGVPGIFGVLACTYFSMTSARHASLYAIVWIACVPAWLSATTLGETLATIYEQRARLLTIVGVVASLVIAVSLVRLHPFTLRMRTMPSTTDPEVVEMVYPTGAVHYLGEQHFRGNVLTHFNVGSYVSWRLYPAVKVSLDGRYEVAYPNDVVADIQDFFHAKPNWKDVLAKYPTDVALVLKDRPIAILMANESGWTRVYADDAQELWARPGLALPVVDASGKPIWQPENPFDVQPGL